MNHKFQLGLCLTFQCHCKRMIVSPVSAEAWRIGLGDLIWAKCETCVRNYKIRLQIDLKPEKISEFVRLEQQDRPGRDFLADLANEIFQVQIEDSESQA